MILGALFSTTTSFSAFSVGDLHPSIKEWCEKHPTCVECKQFEKFIFCAQKRPFPWEVAVAEKNDDTKTLSTDMFCEEDPWNKKWWPVSTDEGKYITFDNIFKEVEHLLRHKEGYSKYNTKMAIELTEIVGKQLQQLAREKTYSHGDLKKALSYLPDEFGQLCATNVHDRNYGFIVAAFKNPALYHTAELAEHVIKIGQEQQWSGDQVVHYMTQINEAFGKRKIDIIKNFLLKAVHYLPAADKKELDKDLARGQVKIEVIAESVATVCHHLMDGNIRKAYYTIKKDFKAHKKS